MAGTLPHAVFVETDVDGTGQAVAFAGELTGCAAWGPDPGAAVAAVPARVTEFVSWLRSAGEDVEEPIGNWYEVERAAAGLAATRPVRAAFSLDELSPTAVEFETWTRWAELAREDLASALDVWPEAAELATWVADQDDSVAADLGAPPTTHAPGTALDRLYAARDRLSGALSGAGAGGGGVRRALRLAIANDLRAAEQVRKG